MGVEVAVGPVEVGFPLKSLSTSTFSQPKWGRSYLGSLANSATILGGAYSLGM
jgi:hypothetical protein